ncbi:MAG: 50S ribosomal protein L9 [Flavobacteriales bacterium AspAUS03]
MRIILKKDIENLGFKYDELNVKPGHARNYLIPQGYAIAASPSALKELNEVLKQRAKKEEALINKAKQIAKGLNLLNLKISTKAGRGGKLFGSVYNQDLTEALAKEGIQIDKKLIRIVGSTIKTTGKYQASIRLHRQLEAQLFFEVVATTTESKKKD